MLKGRHVHQKSIFLVYGALGYEKGGHLEDGVLKWTCAMQHRQGAIGYAPAKGLRTKLWHGRHNVTLHQVYARRQALDAPR